MAEETVDVIIAGGGPFGLMMAIELGRRGVSAFLADEKSSTVFNPQANATQARTMEHYRRLGFADEIRSLGLPPEFPTDIAYYTRFATHELARFKLPSASEARRQIVNLAGSWSAAELPHRVSQKFVEQVLRRKAEELPGISVNFGSRLVEFKDHGDCVTAGIESADSSLSRSIRAKYLVAGDGARSFVRRQLGIRYSGDGGAERDFFGGRMFALYLRAPEFYKIVPHPPAWMNVTFNQNRRAFMCAVDGKGEFAFHTQLREGEDEAQISDEDALSLFQAAVGAPVKAELLSRGVWTAGYALVAERYGAGRVMLGGDAVHLFTPAGGLGYNTAVDDAVNLGWKLAAVIKGHAKEELLQSYELERRPVAIRNTGYAKGFAESIGLYLPPEGLEDEGSVGEALRREAGAYLEKHGKTEFNIPGITFGARFQNSPIIVSDNAPVPPDSANIYIPSAAPGGRAPHHWLKDGRSLFDTFGFDWTLLRLGSPAPAADHFAKTAAAAGMGLKVVDLTEPEILDLYGASLILIRPDQVVAWRGNDDQDAAIIVEVVLGRRGQSEERKAS